MFNQASAFNQDLTGWDVSYFSSQPSNFSAYAASWDASNQPGWPNEPTDNCYKMSFLGTIGTSGVCKDMLIVNSGVLETAKNTGYAIEGPDGNSYTFTDSTYNVFTGQITDFSWDMYGASAGDINYWDVSNATNMSGMFQSDFNGNISSWNVSNVTNMAMMFRNNSSFNQDLSSWNVSKVTQMQEMFSGATAFDGNISSWDVSKVTQAHTMFKGAASFNQDLSSWDVGGVSDMHDMFNGATSFNGNISLWDVSNVTNMNNMFNQASAFNQDLTGWDVSYFSSQPSNFSAYAASWDASNQPGWGYPGFASSSPVDDSSNIALDADITLTFSENVQAGTGNITLYKSDATIVQTFNVSSDISISSATITLDPTADLISGTGYYIQVDATAVEDTSSNVFPGIADNSTFNFTAGLDSTLPTLVSSSPSDDATDIATSSSITLNFNETVQVATGKITLFNSDDTIFQAFDVTSDVSIFNSSVTVNPTAQLSQGGSYYIQVDATAIEDLSSNTFAGIADKTTLNFSVVTDTTAPTLSSVSIASNNSTTTQALENDIVNLTFTASEPISTPVVTFNSGGAAITDTSVTYTNTSGNTWTAAYTANASDTSGVVTFSIAFSDIAGNAGIAVISGSGVVTASLDTTAPIISSVGLNSDNNALTVNFNESVYDTTNGNGDLEVADFTLSISGGTATLNSAIPTSITKTSQTVWVLGFSTSGTANGSETITVVPASSTSIYDAAANAAATSQSNNMASLNDATIPTLSSVSIATNNAITSVANDGDVVTLTLTASEAISTPTVTFKSGGAAITDTSVTYTNTTGNTWTAAYTANASDTFGAVTFSIAYSDTAGNAAAAVTTTTNSSSVSFMPTPSAAFAGVKADVESKMAANARTQLNDFTTSTSSIVGSARSRFMNTSGVADSSDTALSGDVSSDSSDLKGSTKRVSSTADGKATSIIEVQYQYTETKEGLKSQNASGQIINEAKLSDSLTFGRFLGVTLGDGDAVGTNNIDIDFMGAQAGAYLVGNTKGGLVYDTYFAGSVIENKMGVTTSLMTADTKYYSSMLTTGASITGTLQVKKVEIRPTFSTDLSYMFRETADFDVKVGSATSVEQAAYGDIAKAQITFAPEFRLPFGEGSVITATPNVMCRYLKQGTDTEDCGQGISLGFKSTSKDGLLNLTAKAGMDRIGNETTSTLKLQFEKRF
jgi:surface protein